MNALPVLHALLARVGHYAGHGINHEDEPFHAELHIVSLDVQPGVTLKFRAVGIDGTVYHDERTWIALDTDDTVALWSIHTNGGGVRKHARRPAAPVEGAVLTLVFGFGALADRTCYRQEIGIDLWPDGDISYRYAWGLPGGDHQPRSTVRLRATS
jgi:hypothetical protein